MLIKFDNIGRNFVIGKYLTDLTWAYGKINDLTKEIIHLKEQNFKFSQELILIRNENQKLQQQNKYWENLFFSTFNNSVNSLINYNSTNNELNENFSPQLESSNQQNFEFEMSTPNGNIKEILYKYLHL